MGADDVGEARDRETAVCVEDDGGGGFVRGGANDTASQEVVEELGFAGAGLERGELDGGWVSRARSLPGAGWTGRAGILRCWW